MPPAAKLRVALWTIVALAVVRLQILARRRWQQIIVPSPPAGSIDDAWIVRGVLRRLRATCLPRALILQRWLAASGEPRDVVVGVATQPTFRAHAWLAGETAGREFQEISRRAVPSPRPGGAPPPVGG